MDQTKEKQTSNNKLKGKDYYQYSELLKLYKGKNEQKSASLTDLQKEINETKREIKSIKDRLNILELYSQPKTNHLESDNEFEREFNHLLIGESSFLNPAEEEEKSLEHIGREESQKWYS